MTQAAPSAQRDQWAFLLLASVIFSYVAVRAALVSWVHDESTSIFWYVERGEFLPYVALWDAGNHFLSTAIGILGYELWDLSLIGSRAGSLIAFPIYAWSAYRIGETIGKRAVRWICWLALLMCPFLLDFFSLFRGYALGMAFWLVAIDGGLRYFATRSDRHLIQLLLGLFLADMAVLSLVPLWALVVAATGIQLLAEWRTSNAGFPWRKSAIWALLGLVPLLFGLLLAWEMRRRGLLYHGTTEGFVTVTLSSLSNYVLGSRHFVLLLITSVTIIAATMVIYSRRQFSSHLAMPAVLLWADVFMRIGMAIILGVNYPEDRAALHMVPLAILLIAFAADALPAGQRWLHVIFLLLLLFLPIRTLFTANLDHTQLWPEQSVPTRFLVTIAELQQQYERPLMIGAYHQLGYSLPYSAKLHGVELNPPDVQHFTTGEHDVRVVDDRFLQDALPGYTEFDHAPGNGLHLLIRQAPLNILPQDAVNFRSEDPTAEFLEIWKGDQETFNKNLFVEVRCDLAAEMDFLDLYLVVSLDQGDSSVYYHSIPVSQFRSNWSGEEYRCMVYVPALPASKRVVYFWNTDKVPVSVSNGHYREHLFEPDAH